MITLSVFSLSACGGEDTPAQSCTPSAPPSIPLERWSPGAAAYLDVTQTWGLEAIGAQGVRIAAVDYDGDGWTDLVIRRAGVVANDFSPAGVRGFWLLRNTGAQFEDVTQTSGLLQSRFGGGWRPGEVVAFADVDNDGDLDAYVGIDTSDFSKSGGHTSEIMLNDGDGTFSHAPDFSEVRSATRVDRPAGASFVDFDRDGNVDLWVTQHGEQDRLYTGDGGGHFYDATFAHRLATQPWTDVGDINAGRAHTRAWGAAACDLNGDGNPELLSPSYGRSPNHLWQGSEFGFDNRSVASGYAYDEDLTWEDNQFARCYCEMNPAAAGCAGMSPPLVVCADFWDHSSDRQPFRLGGNSSSAFCADVDNDGDFDLLTGEIRHWWAGSGADGSELLVNDGAADVTFSRPGDATTGLDVAHSTVSWDEGHMTHSVFDFDNDGWPDIYQGASDYDGNRGLLYHQTDPLRFEPVPTLEGIDHPRSHGVAVADFDRDGDLDVVAGHSRARCSGNACYPTEQVRAFLNVFGHRNHWLQLELVGADGTNRSAVGARVTVNAGGVTQTQEVGGGYGHYGAQNDLVLHFGLGDAPEAEVTVRWPNETLDVETFTLFARNRYRVEQGGHRECVSF